MGSILAKNLLEEKTLKAAKIKVIDPSQNNKISQLTYFKTAQDLPKNYQADLVFICIKPQGAKEILSDFSQSKNFKKNTIFISILAGKKIEFFEKIFGKTAKIIRSMPNLPIQDSQGIFSYFPNKNIAATELKKLEKIFQKFGLSFQMQNEKLFDAVTAIFGSGPAYIFLLQEIFAQIATKLGIEKNTSAELIKTLFLGSALMSCNSKSNFSDLRESVTSKGGTTQAALDILQEKSALKNLITNAINAAIERSKELSRN